MNRLAATCLLLLTLAAPALAQTAAPAVEIAAGYSLLPSDFLDDFPRGTSHGIQGDVAVNLNRWFGVAGDIAMQWNTNSDSGPSFAGLTAKTTVREFLVGPRFTKRGARVDVFGGGWFGWSIGGTNDDFEGFADSAVTFGGGGGVDVRLSPRTALRAQYDLIGSFADIVNGNDRFGVGLVVRLGER